MDMSMVTISSRVEDIDGGASSICGRCCFRERPSVNGGAAGNDGSILVQRVVAATCIHSRNKDAFGNSGFVLSANCYRGKYYSPSRLLYTQHQHTAMSVTKGVILVGGPSKGTRMRPLSLDCKLPRCSQSRAAH